jgi:hypothetical protein
VAWDAICAGEAVQFCPTVCQQGEPQFGSISCGETICGNAWASGGTRDTDWYQITFDVPTQVTFSIENQLSMVIGIVDTGGVPDCALALTLNPFAVSPSCGSAQIDFCVPAGTWWFFAAPNAFDGFPCDSGNNDYVITLDCFGECVPLACGNAGHDCFTTGGPFCDDVECCETVCLIDPFCCDVAWDALCVDTALNFCVTCPEFACTGTPEGEPCGDDTNGGCNVPIIGDSNCCFANGGLGCDDPDCQAAVCAVDPFCCETAWDGICAGEALQFCPKTCQQGEPQFGSITCGETICGTGWADGNLRDTDWFQITNDGDTGIFVTMTASAQFPFVFGVVDTDGVPDCGLATALNPFATGTSCTEVSLDACLLPGTWWLFIAPNAFAGVPCNPDDDGNKYSFSLACTGKCEGPPPPAACFTSDHDCFTTGVPGCTDIECCTIVCDVDPFCCSTAWDGICVSEAVTFCGAKAPANDTCADAIAVGLGSTDFSTIGATTDGPPLPPECERGFGLTLDHDVWYTYTAGSDGTLTVDVCSATYDSRIAIYTGSCDALVLEECDDDGCGIVGGGSTLSVPVSNGTTYTIRIGGFTTGSFGTGTMVLSQ